MGECDMREVYRDEFLEEMRNKSEVYRANFEKGRKESMLDIALRMLKMNLSVELISECTTLPVEEVLRLKAANGLV